MIFQTIVQVGNFLTRSQKASRVRILATARNLEHAQAKLPKYATNIIYQSNIDKSNNESLESNESSLEEHESDEIKYLQDV